MRYWQFQVPDLFFYFTQVRDLKLPIPHSAAPRCCFTFSIPIRGLDLRRREAHIVKVAIPSPSAKLRARARESVSNRKE